jgi:hypothetical protein
MNIYDIYIYDSRIVHGFMPYARYMLDFLCLRYLSMQHFDHQFPTQIIWFDHNSQIFLQKKFGNSNILPFHKKICYSSYI